MGCNHQCSQRSTCGYANWPQCHEAKANADLQRRLEEGTNIVDRVWKALGISTYEGAGGKSIDEIVADQRAHLAAAEVEKERLKKQLPEGMEDCTIRFIECPVGHGRLIAANWIDNGCPWCQLAAAQEREKELMRDARIYLAVADDDPILTEPTDKLIYSLRERCRVLGEKYDELIYAVGLKFPDETRHETALRYIRGAETSIAAALAEKGENGAPVPAPKQAPTGPETHQ